MKVEMLKIADIKPFDRNPKIHTQKQLEMLQKSIKEFGFTNPVLLATGDTVVAGHARITAAKELGMTEVPVIRLDIPADKAPAYVIADNRLAELGSIDVTLLQAELEELLAIADFDIESVGYTDDQIDALLNIDTDFSFGSGNSVSDDENYAISNPDDMVEVEGKQVGISYAVHVSFSKQDGAEAFLEKIGCDKAKFLPGKHSTIVDGDKLVY